MGDNYFVRDSGVPTVKVNKGAKVTWVWRGKSLHNVKVTKGPAKFGSASQTKGTLRQEAEEEGHLHDRLHGRTARATRA